MLKLVPFSNGSEAVSWYEGNCAICRTKCHFKKNIELSFGSANITLKTAEFIGYDINKSFNELENNDCVNLYPFCQNIHKYKSKKRKRIKNVKQQMLF